MSKTAAKDARIPELGTDGRTPLHDRRRPPVRRGRVGDPRRGHRRSREPAFEQRGVEFPKTWSQNATNIVAQKYFRGQLGIGGARALRQADDRPRRRHDRRLGPRGRLLRDRRRRRRLRGRADPHPAPPEGRLQLARSGSTSASRSTRSARPASSSASRTRWSRSSTGTRKEGMIFRGGSGLGHQPLQHPRLEGAPLQGRPRLRPGQLHARRRRLGRARSSPAARPAARPRWSCSTSTIPTSRTSSGARRARRRRPRPCATPASTCRIDGDGFTSIQYQNANNSVRVTDEFMQAVERATTGT